MQAAFPFNPIRVERGCGRVPRVTRRRANLGLDDSIPLGWATCFDSGLSAGQAARRGPVSSRHLLLAVAKINGHAAVLFKDMRAGQISGGVPVLNPLPSLSP